MEDQRVGFFSRNLKFLRKRRNRTQDEVATALHLKRSTLSGYENGVAQPGLDVLVAFSEYFNLSIDLLVKVDLGRVGESKLAEFERGGEGYVRGTGLRILATTVDRTNNENIELVPEKAKAGYSSGYADPEFIGRLPVFQLPFLSPERKYRTFQISGDSMIPIPNGAWITGEFVRNWQDLRSGEACVILTNHEGIVFKIIENQIESQGSLLLKSLNPFYQPYRLDAADIQEIWRFVHFISTEMPASGISNEEIYLMLNQIKTDLRKILD